MRVVAIVPAHNEAPRIAAVLRPLQAAGCLAGILVVDDGSTDGTADVARAEGVQVLSLTLNRGKGGAMLAATQQVLADASVAAVAYVDADLLGLRPDHVCALVSSVRAGAGMACGMRDDGPARSFLAMALPPITGERVVRREILQALPRSLWDGYGIEVGLDVAACRSGMRTELIPLDGCHGLHKLEKLGVRDGAARHAAMFREILLALGRAQRLIPGEGLCLPP